MVTPLRRGGAPGLDVDLRTTAPLLHDRVVLPGCGYWTQQEHPAEVNAALLDFLGHVDGPARR